MIDGSGAPRPGAPTAAGDFAHQRCFTMPTHRTRKTLEVKQRLLSRLHSGCYRPGDRFLSNRDVAELFGISYQTAHRLIVELCDERHLERRPQSGTYVPGGAAPLVGVQLVFDARAQKSFSFGSKLVDRLTARLAADGVNWTLSWTPDEVRLDPERLPVVWESPATVEQCLRLRRQAVLINDRPRGGLESLLIDSVSTDDFLGGACAGELLRGQARARRGFAVLAGNIEDRRSRQRVEGFLSVVPAAAVVNAASWFFADGLAVAQRVVGAGRSGIFCCNDQLASAVVEWCRQHEVKLPPLVGFDDAPIAEALNITTIAIPWEELVEGVSQLARRRLAGDRATSSRQIFNPRPVFRGTCPRADGPLSRRRRKTAARGHGG